MSVQAKVSVLTRRLMRIASAAHPGAQLRSPRGRPGRSMAMGGSRRHSLPPSRSLRRKVDGGRPGGGSGSTKGKSGGDERGPWRTPPPRRPDPGPDAAMAPAGVEFRFWPSFWGELGDAPAATPSCRLPAQCDPGWVGI
jgi:hypothetical protein